MDALYPGKKSLSDLDFRLLKISTSENIIINYQIKNKFNTLIKIYTLDSIGFFSNRESFQPLGADFLLIQAIKIRLNQEYLFLSNVLRIWKLDLRDFFLCVSALRLDASYETYQEGPIHEGLIRM